MTTLDAKRTAHQPAPAAWPMVPLGEVLRKCDDWVSILPDRAYREVTVRLWGKGVTLRREVLGAEIKADRRCIVRPNQFILSRIDARNGAFGLVPPELDQAVVSNDFPAFDPNTERLFIPYLGWISRTQAFIDLCTAASEGTTNRVRLKEDRFLTTAIPLPPLAEQRRIVARIEELAAKIAEAQCVRHEAASAIAALAGAKAAELFAGRCLFPTRSVGDIATVRGGIQKGPHRTPGQNPARYLTVAHVHRNEIRVDDPRYFEVTPDELERWRLIAGDVLIIEGNGSADQIGRTAIFRGEIADCVHQNHVIRIRPDRSLIDPDYLNAYMNSPAGQDEVQARSRTTSGLRSLSVGRIRQIEVPLPPLIEQRRIVAHLDALSAKLEALKQFQAATAAELDALLPSVLDKAFKGEL